MKLHWSPRSPFVRKVLVAAHELGLASQIATVWTVVAMGQTNVALQADNPLSKIPTLVLDDGTALHDSLTICEYLDDLAGGGRLLPRTGPARWHTLTQHALGNGLLDLLVLWRNEREKPDGQQTPAWHASFKEKTGVTLDRLEGASPFYAERPFDLGHIAIGCALSYLDFRFPDLRWRDSRPNLTSWHAAFSQRPSVIATQIIPA